MTAQKELKNCTFAKTVLMLLIVIYHSVLFWTGSWLSSVKPCIEAPVLSGVAKYLTSFHIYAFALISGYIFGFVKFEKGGYAEALPFVKNKFVRLIIPYIFVSVMWAIPFYLLVNNGNISGVINKFLLAKSPDQLWFLVMLFVVFIMAFFLCKIWRDRNILGLMTVVILYGASIVGPRIIPNFFMIWTACAYCFVFYTGFKLRQYSDGSNKFFVMLRKVPSVIYIAIHLILYIAGMMVDGMDSKVFTLIGIGLDFLTNALGAVMAFFVLTRLGEKLSDNKTVKWFSKISMPVYLFHQQIIYVTAVCFNGILNPYIHSLVNFILSFGISVIISVVLMKFKATRFLIGEK